MIKFKDLSIWLKIGVAMGIIDFMILAIILCISIISFTLSLIFY